MDRKWMILTWRGDGLDYYVASADGHFLKRFHAYTLAEQREADDAPDNLTIDPRRELWHRDASAGAEAVQFVRLRNGTRALCYTPNCPLPTPEETIADGFRRLNGGELTEAIL